MRTAVLYCGIDPGKEGAVGALFPSGEIAFIMDTPIVGGLYDELEMYSIILKVKQIAEDEGLSILFGLEKQQAMKGGKKRQSPATAFEMGVGFGLWRMALVASGVPRKIVPPMEWQKLILAGEQRPRGCKSRHEELKLMGHNVAMQRWADNTPLLVGPKGGRKSGRTDALLIADWVRRELGQEDR